MLIFLADQKKISETSGGPRLKIKSSKEFWTPHIVIHRGSGWWVARLKIIFWISTPDFHLGVEFDSTLTIVNNEKISLYFRQLIQDIQSILINKLSFLVSMARLGEAIKCYSFQSWPLEPILRDPLCIMKMVHMMIKKTKQIWYILNHLSLSLSLTFSHLIAEQEKVCQRGSGAESRARSLRADQGLYMQN